MENLNAEATGNESSHNQEQPKARDSELLLHAARCARFFRSADGRFLARVPVNGREEIFGLRSSAFRDWLVDGYLNEHGKLPTQRAVNSVLQALEARARFDSEKPVVCVRVGLGEIGN